MQFAHGHVHEMLHMVQPVRPETGRYLVVSVACQPCAAEGKLNFIHSCHAFDPVNTVQNGIWYTQWRNVECLTCKRVTDFGCWLGRSLEIRPAE